MMQNIKLELGEPYSRSSEASPEVKSRISFSADFKDPIKALEFFNDLAQAIRAFQKDQAE